MEEYGRIIFNRLISNKLIKFFHESRHAFTIENFIIKRITLNNIFESVLYKSIVRE